jgi:hypothetical protein
MAAQSRDGYLDDLVSTRKLKLDMQTLIVRDLFACNDDLIVLRQTKPIDELSIRNCEDKYRTLYAKYQFAAYDLSTADIDIYEYKDKLLFDKCNDYMTQITYLQKKLVDETCQESQQDIKQSILNYKIKYNQVCDVKDGLIGNICDTKRVRDKIFLSK